MAASRQEVVCRIDERRIGFPLESVERIVRAVAPTPLAGAPDCVPGIINFQGRILPVISLRKLQGMVDRQITPADLMVVADAAGRRVAIVADDADVVAIDGAAVTAANEVVCGISPVREVVKLDDGLAILQDIHRLLSEGEKARLQSALAARGGVA